MLCGLKIAGERREGKKLQGQFPSRQDVASCKPLLGGGGGGGGRRGV